MAISDQQRKAGLAFFGEELFNEIVKEGEEKTKELEEAGVSHKEADPKEEPAGGGTEVGEKQVAEFARALRDIAGEVEDEGIKTQIENAAEGLTKANMDERGRTLRMVAGRLPAGDLKTRLAKIAAAMVEGEDYPQPGEDSLSPKEMGEFTLEDMAKAVKELFELDMQPIAEALTAIAAEQLEVKERLEKIEKAEALKAQTEVPRFVFSMMRASDSEKTVVEDDDPLLEMKPKATPTLKQGDGSMASAFFKTPK